jgi:hypothetical protein
MYRTFPIYLWVEDEETRTYLQTVWEGDPIGYYVAGGHSPISAIVEAAHNDWNAHVFGVRDRDFTPPNRARWRETDVKVFAGDALEIENYLLDAEAIAACDVNTSGKTVAQIEHQMRTLASSLVWWMSCRRTITEIRDAVASKFPEHPSRTKVHTQQDALRAIVEDGWWSTVLPSLNPKWGDRTTVEAALKSSGAFYSAALTNDTWHQEFSGKEILSELLSGVWTKKRPPDPEGRLTFVQEIARTQRKLRRVPNELTGLRDALRHRTGR